MIEDMARVCARWPGGREDPVPRSTLYRWLQAYQADPRIESLMPAERDKHLESVIKPEWCDYALALLEEEPARSLFVLGRRIQDRFQLPKPPARSSLHRAICRQPRYVELQRRANGESRLRRRFQALHPHDIWHADAKADFTVRFTNGEKRNVRILSILDDATRFVLTALVVASESLAAAVATFRAAASRYGLPGKFYADRGSAYDSDAFRRGLAILGIHRINTRPRNPSAHGKIEAYHRSLHRWFIQELSHQPLRDISHLQALLDAFIDQLYHQHIHRELMKTPAQAFNAQISPRAVSLERLRDAFLVERELRAHLKTGELRIEGRLFLVPKHLITAQRYVRIAIDTEHPDQPLIVIRPGVFEPLPPAFPPPAAAPAGTDNNEPVGSLTPLLEKYRGRILPQARSGFGLPEIYSAFSHALGRHIPATEAEASALVQWLAQYGPFEPQAFAFALDQTIGRLGPGRPLTQVLQSLTRMIDHSQPGKETKL
jgi:transposase InsO family protein